MHLQTDEVGATPLPDSWYGEEGGTGNQVHFSSFVLLTSVVVLTPKKKRRGGGHDLTFGRGFSRGTLTERVEGVHYLPPVGKRGAPLAVYDQREGRTGRDGGGDGGVSSRRMSLK
jgi:hypothetical protein